MRFCGAEGSSGRLGFSALGEGGFRRRAHQAFEGEEFKRFSVFGFWPNGPADGLTHFGGEGRGVV